MASAPPISPKCIVYHPQQHKWAEERAEKPNILLCKCTRLQAMNHNPISSCNFQPFQFPIKHHFLQLQCFQFPIKDTWTHNFFGTKVKFSTSLTFQYTDPGIRYVESIENSQGHQLLKKMLMLKIIFGLRHLEA